MMDGTVKKCLMRWHEYSDSVTDALQSLRYQEELLDVTLACEGKTVRAHKLVLAACSQYFRRVFREFPCEHPTIILDGISWKDLLNILQFMYCGLVFVDEESACSLLNAAYTLDVVGLNYVTEALLENKTNSKSEEYKERPKPITEYKERPKPITKIKYKSDSSNYENSLLSSVICNNCNNKHSSNSISNNNDCNENVSTCLNQISQKDNATANNTPITNISFPSSYSYFEPNIYCLDNSNNSNISSNSNNSSNSSNSKKSVKNDFLSSSNNSYNKKCNDLDNELSTAKIINHCDVSDSDNSMEPVCKKPKIGNEDSSVELQRDRRCDEVTGEVRNGFVYNKISNEVSVRNISQDQVISQHCSSEEASDTKQEAECGVRKMSESCSSMPNGDSGTSSRSFEGLDNVPKPFEDHHSLDNEASHDEASLDNGDTDMGPAPLPLNHPAILASSKSTIAVVSAAAAALAAAASNGGNVTSNINYAAYIAANSRSMLNNSSGAGNMSPLHNTPSPTGMSFSSWMTQNNYSNSGNTSPSPSPPSLSGGLPPGFIHPPGMSQQDLQATLEHYQRKLAFHEPRPCPTCRRMYRDAATLRTHIAIMHSEGKEPFTCSCGAYFRTKYDMYQHKKNGHR